MGTRNPGTVQFEVWITREASDAINVSAQKLDITRGQYLQDAIWAALTMFEDNIAGRPRDYWLPVPVHTNVRYQRYERPKAGYKGRWSMWVRVRCTVNNAVPMRLTRTAERTGYGSGSALVRHYLAIAIKADTGKTVTMPPGRTSANLFGGAINEVVR